MSFRSTVSWLCGVVLLAAATAALAQQGPSEYGATPTGPAAGATSPTGAGQRTVKSKSKAKTAKAKAGASSKAKQGQ